MSADVFRDGFGTVTPYLVTDNPDGLVAFARDAFGGVETFRATGSAGGFHIEMRLGDSMIMIGGGGTSGTTPMPAMLYLYLNGVDAAYRSALAAGATSLMAPTDQPDGERRAGVADPYGNMWYMGWAVG